MASVLSWLKRSNLVSPPPVLLLEGSEARLARRVVDALREFHVESGMGELNFLRLEAPESSPREVIEHCQGLPMLAPRMVVVVDGIEGWKQEEATGLLPYLEAPNPDTTLTLITPKLDGRTNFAKALKRHALCLSCAPLSEGEARRWCERAAERRGIRLAQGVTDLLIEALGTDLYLLETELDKLALQVGADGLVDRSLAEKTVVGHRLPQIWDFTDQLAAGDRAGALGTIHSLLTNGQHPLSFLGMVVRHFRLLIQAKEGLRRGASPRAMEQKLGLFRGRSDALFRQAKRFDLEELKATYPRLLAADLDCKGRGLSPRLALEKLVLELCR